MRVVDVREDGMLVEVAEKPHSQRFEEFHAANPNVYTELVSLARHAKARGVARYGIRSLWEVMRWNLMMRFFDENTRGVHLNDHYHSRYARLIMEQEADLAGFFEIRRLKTS